MLHKLQNLFFNVLVLDTKTFRILQRELILKLLDTKNHVYGCASDHGAERDFSRSYPFPVFLIFWIFGVFDHQKLQQCCDLAYLAGSDDHVTSTFRYCQFSLAFYSG